MFNTVVDKGRTLVSESLHSKKEAKLSTLPIHYFVPDVLIITIISMAIRAVSSNRTLVAAGKLNPQVGDIPGKGIHRPETPRYTCRSTHETLGP
jgi:hypothetical protein